MKIKGIFNGKLLSLVENGYKVAKDRDIKTIGKQLEYEYKKLMAKCQSN